MPYRERFSGRAVIERFFVITGGPGSGKSSLVAALRDAGMAGMEEGGRAIIREQVETGGTALPWADREAFAALMHAHDQRCYRAAEAMAAPVVFDRGIPDVIGYRHLVGLPVPARLKEATREFRYNRLVFVAPPWRDIFAQDAERRQDFVEAEATFEAMTRVYGELGYALVPLPLVSVAARAAFVADRIGRALAEGRRECT